MSTPPKVSVIIPAYNAAPFIHRAVDSVLGQTFADYELIVVDDGSSDDTLRVLARYGDRLRVLTQLNSGPAAARNHGLSAACGKYVAFLDADDHWLPEKLERQVQLMERRPDVGFCSTATKVVNSAGETVRNWPCRSDVTAFPDALFTQSSLISGSTSGVLACRKLIEALGGFDEALRGFEDPDLWIRLSAVTTYACIAEPLTVVVRTPNSVSGNLARMRKATLASYRKNRHLLPPGKRGGYWRAACASTLTDYAKSTYRAGHRGMALRWTLEAFVRSPLGRGRLALSLLLAMLLKQPL